MLQNYTLFNRNLDDINQQKVLINTINAHSFNTLKKDEVFNKALQSSNILLPDGISMVLAMRLLTGQKIQKIAGADLFAYEMKRLNTIGGKCFFLGSSESTLKKIRERAKKEYPNVKIHTYSPPFRTEFSAAENKIMIDEINAVMPDTLFVGMTAPKQEKWAYNHYEELKVGHVCCIGAVFDFYAGTVKRAPEWMIEIGMEWLYRLLSEPRRMWRRYIIGNTLFIWYIFLEKIKYNSPIPLRNDLPIFVKK